MKYIFGVVCLLLLSQQSFSQDTPNLVSIFNADSTLVGTGVFRNGAMQGLWRFQNPQTNALIQTITFDNGIRSGVATSFHANNNKHVEAEYQMNKLNGIYRQFDRTGTLKIEMVFRDSLAVGPYREFYGREGQDSFVNPRQVKTEGQFTNGMKHGKWVTFYPTGDLALVENFENGNLSGPYLEYAISGELMVQTSFKDNKPDGSFVRYSFESIVEETGEFSNGNRIGKWVAYFPGTSILESEKYYDTDGNRTGEWRFYYENKRLARIERYENDIPVGVWEEFFPNKNVSKRKTYELGLPIGPYIENHSNGKVSVEGQYTNGMKEGLWKSYFPEGNLYSIGEYKNDLKTGLWKYFNKIGILTAEGEYSLGLENGQWFYYYDGGQLKSVGSYFLGFEDGLWGLFYDNKQLTQEETWSNGRLLNIGDYYSYDGSKTLDKGTLVDGNGTRNTYYVTGSIESQGNYKDGKANGTWTYFHDNGKKASEGPMIDGKKEGAWKYYNLSGRLEQIINYRDDEIVEEPGQFNPMGFRF